MCQAYEIINTSETENVMDFSSSIKSHFFRNHDSHYDFSVFVFMVCRIILLTRLLLDSCRSHTWVGGAMKLVPFTNLMYARIGEWRREVLRGRRVPELHHHVCQSFMHAESTLSIATTTKYLGWLETSRPKYSVETCSTAKLLLSRHHKRFHNNKRTRKSHHRRHDVLIMSTLGGIILPPRILSWYDAILIMCEKSSWKLNAKNNLPVLVNSHVKPHSLSLQPTFILINIAGWEKEWRILICWWGLLKLRWKRTRNL